MAQWTKNLTAAAEGHCEGVGSIPGLGTSDAMGGAKKKKSLLKIGKLDFIKNITFCLPKDIINI